RCEVDAHAAVIRLQVDDANPVVRGELLHERAIPVGAGIELELERRVELEIRLDLRARRDDEANRLVRPSDRLAERHAALAQREIERGALECPAPEVAQLELVEPPREVVERPRAR